MRNGVKFFRSYDPEALEEDVANWLDAWDEREPTHTTTIIGLDGEILHIVHYRDFANITSEQETARFSKAALS